MSTTGGSNPEYVIARVRARRSALFGDEEYRKLVRMGPAEIARFMEESEYEAEVNALGSRFSGVDLIEYALNQNLAKQFNDILDWADGRLYDLIARYLRKFDAWNVKTVIRGLYSGASREEVESDLIRAGEFDDRLISRLLDAGEIEEVVSVLSGTIFGDGLAAAYEEYEEVGVLVPLENAVDRAFYEQLLDDLVVGEEAKQYREFLEAEIDFRNARNALRIARSGADLDPVDYFIEGGTLFRATELASLATSPDELVSKIRDSRYGDRLLGGPFGPRSGRQPHRLRARPRRGALGVRGHARLRVPAFCHANRLVHPRQGARGRQHPGHRPRPRSRAGPRCNRSGAGHPMSQEIAVIGSPDFTTGFRLAGVRKFENVPDEAKDDELDEAVTRTLEDEDVGIIVMHEDDLDHLSRNARQSVERSIEPTLVTLGGSGGASGLRDQIKRAIGIDLMDE